MKVLMIPDEGEPYISKIPNTLQSFQDRVMGFIETVRLKGKRIMIVNEEGKIRDFKLNKNATRLYRQATHDIADRIVGQAFVTYEDDSGEDFTDLPDEDISELLRDLGLEKANV